MATAENTALTFCSSRGENISLSEDLKEASWFSCQSGNYIYASEKIQLNAVYRVKVNGSGHVDIGIVTDDPTTISCDRRHPSFKRMNEVKVHKRGFALSMRLDNSQVLSRYETDEYKLELGSKKNAWIAVYPKFGDISVSIKCSGLTETSIPLSRTVGHNIRLEDDDRKAHTIKKSPAAICFTTRKLCMNHKAEFQCIPISETDKKPSRFHLKIIVHRNDPQKLLEDFKGTFSTSVKQASDPPWTYIDILDRDDCIGRVSLILKDTNFMVCSTDKGYKKEMSLPFDATGGLWLIFELYRVSLRMLDFKPVTPLVTENIAAGASGAGNDEPDSIPPTNAGNENVQIPNNIQQENGASGTGVKLSAIQEGMQRIENKVEELHVKIDAVKETSESKDMLSPDAQSPTTNPVELNFRQNLVKLIDNLNADDIIDHLFQESIIGKNFYDKIQSEEQKGATNASRTLLRGLLGKQVDRIVFERILTDTDNTHLIKLFFPDETETKVVP